MKVDLFELIWDPDYIYRTYSEFSGIIFDRIPDKYSEFLIELKERLHNDIELRLAYKEVFESAMEVKLSENPHPNLLELAIETFHEIVKKNAFEDVLHLIDYGELPWEVSY